MFLNTISEYLKHINCMESVNPDIKRCITAKIESFENIGLTLEKEHEALCK